MTTRSNKYSNTQYRLFRTRSEELRKKGLSYKDIRKEIPVSKSTLSIWLREIKLTTNQIKQLGARYDSQLKGAKANQKKSQERKNLVRKDSMAEIPQPTKEALKIAGAMLYWAEGNKTCNTGLTNSDPALIVFFIEWLRQALNIQPTQLTAHLNLHRGGDGEKEKKFWSKLTRIPLANFGKTFFKPRGKGYRKNRLYHGTIRIRIKGTGTVLLRYKILGWAEGFIQYYVSQQIIEANFCKKTGR